MNQTDIKPTTRVRNVVLHYLPATPVHQTCFVQMSVLSPVSKLEEKCRWKVHEIFGQIGIDGNVEDKDLSCTFTPVIALIVVPLLFAVVLLIIREVDKANYNRALLFRVYEDEKPTRLYQDREKNIFKQGM